MKKTILLSILAFVLGAFSFLSVIYIQAPIQRLLTSSNFFYKINSLFLMALLYGLISAIIQRSFTLISASFSNTYALAGFLSGLGFGLVESIYFIYPYIANFGVKFLLSFDFFSRILSTIFHASCTGIVMIGIYEKKFALYFIPIVLIHTTIAGLSVFSQTAKIMEISFFIISFIVTIVLFVYFMFISNKMKIVLKGE
ncbi:MAG: hypothetical protein GYA61_01905 [Spirochaetales bacterium]|nr:hypothetical protein [Spirochaetales bacterium]